jgi:hypothetical protein
MNYEKRAFALLNGANCVECKFYGTNIIKEFVCKHEERIKEYSDCIQQQAYCSPLPLIGYCTDFKRDDHASSV